MTLSKQGLGWGPHSPYLHVKYITDHAYILRLCEVVNIIIPLIDLTLVIAVKSMQRRQ